jgi:hypothetical protein
MRLNFTMAAPDEIDRAVALLAEVLGEPATSAP